ncbi:MAG: hypothetical protein QOI66_5321 [Myxococcales bacterium]|jgi:dihydrofolate reductase|nr:hypothetical protein [Myxococcales bacterium]
MRKLTVFNQVSLDGYFTDAKGDISWAHKSDPEWDAFVADNAQGGGDGMLLLGRVTYQMMVAFWPTSQAKQTAPAVAEGINKMPKVVFSRTLDEVTWNNTKLVKTGLLEEVRALKNAAGGNITILGSGKLVAQLAPQGLIDQYDLIVNPVVLGRGRTLFEGIETRLALKLAKTRTFKNGNVLMTYAAA